MKQDKPRSHRARTLAAAALVSLVGCAKGAVSSSDAGADATTDAATLVDEAREREKAILRAEHRRSAAEITPADQQSRDVQTRRLAARALARIGGEESRAGLLRALADEDEDVVAWAAYGLGFSCKAHEKETVAALVARSLSLEAGGGAAVVKGEKGEKRDAARLDVRVAIARAVGRCGAEQSEPTLVAWLSGATNQASAAAFALGDLGAVKERLREETIAALLNLAAGSAASPPAPEGLFPIGRLENVPLTVLARLREVASARLAEPGPYRVFAVRALGRAGPEAAPDLARVLGSPTLFTAAERAEAARALRKLGAEGKHALEATLPALLPPTDPIAQTALGDEVGVLLTALESLDAPGKSKKLLRDLAALPAPPDAPLTLARRLSWIRCGAATIVAGSDVRDPLLLACDLTDLKPEAAAADAGAAVPGQPGSIGARALVKVLDRAPITGPRLAAFRAVVRGPDVRAKEAALDLFATHDELETEARALLEEALAAREPGLIATAAEVISRKPSLASEPDKHIKKRGKKKQDAEDEEDKPKVGPPSPAIVKALVAMLGRADIENDAEMAGAMMEAVGALALKEASPRLEELCRSSWPEIRKRAAKAIGLVSGKTPACDAPPGGGPLPPELDARASGEVKITLSTDAGEMTLLLDASIAPVAVTRVADLARAGYYDGVVVHRVVPGFVTQLGAPFGDGFGGPPGKAPLRCETSPVAFDALTVGVALSGRDTGSSQIYVMHGRSPHLDGQYAWIGHATGPWAAFVDGDLVRKASVTP